MRGDPLTWVAILRRCSRQLVTGEACCALVEAVFPEVMKLMWAENTPSET